MNIGINISPNQLLNANYAENFQDEIIEIEYCIFKYYVIENGVRLLQWQCVDFLNKKMEIVENGKVIFTRDLCTGEVTNG